MARSVYPLTIQSSTRYLEDVRRFVAGHAQEAGFSDAAVEQFKIAVDEACTNIIKHAYKGSEAHEIDIAVIVDPERFTVRIRDEGETFNRERYKEPDLFKSIQERRAGGFGVHIMRRLMDNVEYRTRGKINEVRLTKYRSRHQVNGES